MQSEKTKQKQHFSLLNFGQVISVLFLYFTSAAPQTSFESVSCLVDACKLQLCVAVQVQFGELGAWKNI
jgi:hypothetical protein